MSDPVTALNGAAFDGLVSVSETPAQGMITLRADLADAAVITAVKTAIGQDMPAPRGMTGDASAGVLWMSPDEAMILCPYAEAGAVLAKVQDALGEAHALAVDVSDARAFFALAGGDVREVLAKISPADLRAASLPVGEVRRTRLAQVAGAFWLSDEAHGYVVCFRSVAQYVFGLLSTAAKPGSAVGHF